jgi:hypothetical protein
VAPPPPVVKVQLPTTKLRDVLRGRPVRLEGYIEQVAYPLTITPSGQLRLPVVARDAENGFITIVDVGDAWLTEALGMTGAEAAAMRQDPRQRAAWAQRADGVGLRLEELGRCVMSLQPPAGYDPATGTPESFTAELLQEPALRVTRPLPTVVLLESVDAELR